ncbi:MAG: hypothetical protein ACK2UW_00850, partial [Anaerolineales bacterium]
NSVPDDGGVVPPPTEANPYDYDGPAVWVSASEGNDVSGCGTADNPCRTIKKGMSRTSPGVALLVRWVGQYTPPNFLTGLGLIWINGMLMLSISLMGGALLSTLANGVLVFGLFGIAFVGGWIEQFGSLIGNQAAINIGIVSSLILPSEALWRRAAYEMRSPLVAAVGFSPFTSGSSVPSPFMILYALLFLAATLALAVSLFGRRDL